MARSATTDGTAIAGAEFTVDGGSTTAMTLETQGTVASLQGTIPTVTAAALSEGTHTVSVRSRDAAGNWGDPTTATFIIDKKGVIRQIVTGWDQGNTERFSKFIDQLIAEKN